MLFEIVIIILVGWIAGILVNALADELPYRRNPALPVYADGSPRPVSAWSGILAYVLNQRAPEGGKPNPKRKREYDPSNELSWRYPATEFLTIILMLVAYMAAQQYDVPFAQQVFWYIYMTIMALIIVIDIEHKLILFVVIIPSAIIALIDAVLLPVPQPSLANALIGGLIGFVTFYLFYKGGFLFTYLMGKMRGEEINTVAFGYGDVMMITLSGLMVGAAHVIVALFLTVIFGAIGAVVYIVVRSLLGSRYSAFTALPYGPYIVLATILMLLFGEPIRMAMMGV